MVLAYVGILYLETQRFFCGLATTIRLGGESQYGLGSFLQDSCGYHLNS